MSRVLFLDDMIERVEAFLRHYPKADIVYNAAACIYHLKHDAPYDLVCLDHDLGGPFYQDPTQENSGSAVVRWIIENKPQVGQFIVHSWNPTAGPNMTTDLIAAGYKAVYKPFSFTER